MESLIGVEVRGIAAGGSGVADLPDGRVVFVPRTAPGDRVSIRLVKDRARWAEGSLAHVDEPSEERRPALCALYDRCGGCQLQHLPYDRQLEWKGRIVADALTRIGHLEGLEPPEVVPSPRETGYRNRISFTLRRLRGGHVVAGFHALGRPAHVIDVHDECVLPSTALREVWKAVRSEWGPGARLLPDGGRLRLTLRETSEGVALVVDGGHDGWSASKLGSAVPALSAIWHSPGGGPSEPRLLEGVFDEGGPAFAQVNTEVADLMRRYVAEAAGEGAHAVDAYCGAGAYGRLLADQGWKVTGIERDPTACEEAGRGAPEGFSIVQGAVESRLSSVLPADLVIVNPPRAGLDADVVGILATSGPGRIVYVSCDPATLARDVAALSEQYAVAGMRCFDLFPQTAHVETVLVLTHSRGDA
ncbi:MAG: TRAM domain-containing protein [Gemmatimonadota bacterium]|jgi:23S rRNA (uracil1939-C5)-methyltransferase